MNRQSGGGEQNRAPSRQYDIYTPWTRDKAKRAHPQNLLPTPYVPGWGCSFSFLQADATQRHSEAKPDAARPDARADQSGGERLCSSALILAVVAFPAASDIWTSTLTSKTASRSRAPPIDVVL